MTTTQADLLQEYAQEIRSIGEFAQEINAEYDRLTALDKLIAANEAALNKQFIKVPFTKFKVLDDTGFLKPKVPGLLEENKQLVSEYNQLLEKTKTNYDIIKRKERALGQKLQTLTDYPEMIRIGRAIVESIDNNQSWPDLTTILSAVSNQEGKWWSGNRDWSSIITKIRGRSERPQPTTRKSLGLGVQSWNQSTMAKVGPT